jgi:hypothetical protein
MEKTQSQKVLEQLTSLALSFATHVATEADTERKIGEMYKILVTGNGNPPLPEIVRGHTEWIAERDDERCENKKDQKEAAKIKATHRWDVNKSIVLLIFGEALTFIGLVVVAILFRRG